METDLRKLIELNLHSLEFFGYICPNFESTFKKILYRIYGWSFIFFWFILFIISETINMILVFGDMEKMTAGSYLFLTHLNQVIKFYYFQKYETRIHALIHSMTRAQFNPKTEQQRQVLEDDIKTSKSITKTFMGMVVVTGILWGIFPLLEEEVKLPLSGWFPFNTEKSPLFEMVFIYQSVGAVLNGLANISVDSFISGTIMIISGQFTLLNDNLCNLKQRANDIMVDEAKKLDDSMMEVLVQCVDHHRNILEFSREVTTLFTVCIMGQFVIGVIIICITMFQMSLVSVTTLQFWGMFMYQSCILLEAFLQCYYGNEVIVKSTNLTKSAYNSHWIECPIKFKQNLLYFMTRSQMPLKLYAGGFFTLSLETFVTILRTSWSYFAVLSHVHATRQ